MLGNEYSNCVRFLGVDQIRKANSGHTGIVLGASDFLTELYKNHLVFNPNDSSWLARDRFVLSAGHGSAMLYALLYLTGYKDITIDDLKNFRQLNSKTAGHPELGLIAGVEVSTGPLGQGIANAVGIALGQKLLQSKFGELFGKKYGNKTYCLVGDGCLMEGISYEACSFAGHHKLDNLIIIHDDNKITIDGRTDLTISGNVLMRFKACGFETFECDGHNIEEINVCLEKSKNSNKPVFIQAHTHIGYGSLKQDSQKCHGSPLTDEEYNDLKTKMEWKNDPFEIDDKILNNWRSFWKRNETIYKKWKQNFDNCEDKERINKFFECELSISNEKQEQLLKYFNGLEKESTRKSSGKILQEILLENNQVIGGTADLGGSIMSYNNSCKPITKDDKNGNYIHYGIREHSMGAIMNGLATCGFIPYSGTFFFFFYYYRNAIRMSALMDLPVIHILTHDSFYVGEDGATHEPVEHIDSLRIMPNLLVFRPCDGEETLECYKVFLNEKKPCCMVLSRQDVLQIHNKSNAIQNGAYVIFQNDNCNDENYDFTILTSGSEVSLSIDVANKLGKDGKKVRVISVYCLEMFNKLKKEEQNRILYGNSNGIIKKTQKIVAIEAGTGLCLGNLTKGGIIININEFGKSGKAKDLANYFGFTTEDILNKINHSF